MKLGILAKILAKKRLTNNNAESSRNESSVTKHSKT